MITRTKLNLRLDRTLVWTLTIKLANQIPAKSLSHAQTYTKGKKTNSYNVLQQGSLQFYQVHLVQVLNEQMLIALVASVYYHPSSLNLNMTTINLKILRFHYSQLKLLPKCLHLYQKIPATDQEVQFSNRCTQLNHTIPLLQ